MPRPRGFRSMRVYYTVLWRLALASSRQHPTDPTLISQRMLCFPRGDAPAKRLSLYAGFSHCAANTRQRQAPRAAHRTDSDSPATPCFRRGFQLGANRTSLLLPQQGFGRSLSRVREELRESWCLLGLAFPGSMIAPWVHPARPN